MSVAEPITTPTVYIVDDDLAVRDSLSLLMNTVGIQSKSYSTAGEFLSDLKSTPYGCLILDVRMPGLSGLELQQELNSLGVIIPTIIISGHGDIRTAVDSLHAGAIDFLEKPLREQSVLELVRKAFDLDAKQQQICAECSEIAVKLASLSNREREVLDVVVSGKSNKMIAHQLSISHKTVESHRTNIMRKMDAQSIADLVRMSLTAKSHQ